MEFDLLELSARLAGNAVLLGAAAFLVRIIIKHNLEKERSALLNTLQTQSAVELEQLKQALAISSKKNEINESWLHQRRAEALYQLYVKATDLRMRTSLIFDPVFGPKKPDDIRSYTKETWSLLQDFFSHIEHTRVFLSDKTYASVFEVFSAAQDSLAQYLGYLGNYDDDELDTLQDVHDWNRKRVDTQLNPAVEVLLKECHRVYGVPAD